MGLLLCTSALDDIVCTALCKALFLLLCKKLDIPSKANSLILQNLRLLHWKFLSYFFQIQEILVKSSLLHSLIYDEQFYFVCIL